MTALRSDRPIIRETACLERGRAIFVRLHPQYMELRLKGQRKTYLLDWGAALWCAVKADAERAAREKRLRRTG